MGIMMINKENERFVTTKETYFGSVCLICKNITDKKNFKCMAFPEGIPKEIASGKFLHTKEYPNDNGIKFKPIKEYDPSILNKKIKELKKSKSKVPTFKEEYSR